MKTKQHRKRARLTLLIVLAVLAVSNLLASSLAGLGDAEALYYCYGRHLSLSYLDHPPLIGWLLAIATSCCRRGCRPM